MRLLIVEDDAELSEALSALLRQSGYEVDAHADGRPALNALLTSDYDLAIVDLMLPGMNGIALVRNLRRQNRGLPILVITARDSLEDRVGGLDAGVGSARARVAAAAASGSRSRDPRRLAHHGSRSTASVPRRHQRRSSGER